ncbi:MAG: hypothetical protein ACOYW4_01410, partial [Bacillota bacterium]
PAKTNARSARMTFTMFFIYRQPPFTWSNAGPVRPGEHESDPSSPLKALFQAALPLLGVTR